MRGHRWFAVLICAGVLAIMGNAPAPYYACDGRAPGDACQYGYACRANGTCRFDDQGYYEDDPATDLDESLICVTH